MLCTVLPGVPGVPCSPDHQGHPIGVHKKEMETIVHIVFV